MQDSIIPGMEKEVMSDEAKEASVFTFGTAKLVDWPASSLGLCPGCAGPPVLVCGGCPGPQPAYCSQACQAKHWSLHREHCGREAILEQPKMKEVRQNSKGRVKASDVQKLEEENGEATTMLPGKEKGAKASVLDNSIMEDPSHQQKSDQTNSEKEDCPKTASAEQDSVEENRKSYDPELKQKKFFKLDNIERSAENNLLDKPEVFTTEIKKAGDSQVEEVKVLEMSEPAAPGSSETSSVLKNEGDSPRDDSCGRKPTVPLELACGLCWGVRVKMLRLSCNKSPVCWNCAVREISATRKCWNTKCLLEGISTREHLVRDPLLEGMVREYLDKAARSGSDRGATSGNDEGATAHLEAAGRKHVGGEGERVNEFVDDSEKHVSRMSRIDVASEPMQMKTIKEVTKDTSPEDIPSEIESKKEETHQALSVRSATALLPDEAVKEVVGPQDAGPCNFLLPDIWTEVTDISVTSCQQFSLSTLSLTSVPVRLAGLELCVEESEPAREVVRTLVVGEGSQSSLRLQVRRVGLGAGLQEVQLRSSDGKDIGELMVEIGIMKRLGEEAEEEEVLFTGSGKIFMYKEKWKELVSGKFSIQANPFGYSFIVKSQNTTRVLFSEQTSKISFYKQKEAKCYWTAEELIGNETVAVSFVIKLEMKEQAVQWKEVMSARVCPGLQPDSWERETKVETQSKNQERTPPMDQEAGSKTVKDHDIEEVVMATSLEDSNNFGTRMPEQGGKLEVRVLHFDSAKRFFVCSLEEGEELLAFQTRLQDLLCQKPQVQPQKERPQLLQLVLFKSTEDKMWYRGVVLKVYREELFKVYSPDYGFMEKVGQQDIWTRMSSKVSGRPYSARPCELVAGQEHTLQAGSLALISVVEKLGVLSRVCLHF